VSIVIPTTGDGDLLAGCLRSLRATTDYDAFDVVLVDSGPGRAAAVADAELGAIEHRVVQTGAGPFNFSRAVNLGTEHSRGEHVLFLNDDVEALEPDWLERMVEQSDLPGAGAVGVRLRWPEGPLQHCGMALHGLGAGTPGTPGHLYVSLESGSTGPDDLLAFPRECGAVTGACLMVSRAALERIGGWDDSYRLDYGDLDLCLRLREDGGRVVIVHTVTMRHRESASRAAYPRHADWRRFRARWAPAYPEGDPWVHPAYPPGSEPSLPLPDDGV
jgi:GT2 family glycosyltransferase